jgi:hypothetical protein
MEERRRGHPPLLPLSPPSVALLGYRTRMEGGCSARNAWKPRGPCHNHSVALAHRAPVLGPTRFALKDDDWQHGGFSVTKLELVIQHLPEREADLVLLIGGGEGLDLGDDEGPTHPPTQVIERVSSPLMRPHTGRFEVGIESSSKSFVCASCPLQTVKTSLNPPTR